MLFEPLFGTYGSRDGDGNIVLKFSDLEKAIQIDGDYVVFNLKEPFAPFLSILTYLVGSVVDKEFVIANGGWDGTEATWKDFNGPEEGKETLYEIASGTGPYKLVRWEKGVEVAFERNENYWGQKPTLQKAIYKVIEEWSTRKLIFLQGDADNVQVDSMYYEEMNKESGLVSFKELKELGVRSIHFNFDIVATDNPAIYSGKLDGAGIPVDFFNDKNLRLAFAHCWDQETFLRDIINYAGVTTPTPHVSGLPFRDDSLKPHAFDLKKAEDYFKKSWGGQVWEKGFEVDFLYNSGNEVRENSLKLLAENVMSLNPKFKINVRGVEWSTYVDMIRQRNMPIYMVGWGADYPDPHNFMQPFMHSEGHYGGRCSYKNPEVDRLISEGVVETDPAKRKQIYYRLQELYLEDVVGICQYQPIKNEYFRDWVSGYVFHPMENEHRYSLFSKGY
jgi:peptide/nickel transport system substrate-binding protein